MSNENTYNKAAHVVIVVIAENGNCNEPKGIFIPSDDSFEVISSLNAPRAAALVKFTIKDSKPQKIPFLYSGLSNWSTNVEIDLKKYLLQLLLD